MAIRAALAGFSETQLLIRLLILMAAATLLFYGRIRALLIQAMEQFRNEIGPGGPEHPIPSNDARILNRRRRKPEAGS